MNIEERDKEQGVRKSQQLTSFTKLRVWQEGHQFVLKLYQATTHFPKEELFVLTSQMRRAAISITSNIAEGFSRSSFKEKKQFYTISLGSTTELQNQLLISRDLGYINSEDFKELAEQTVSLHKMLNGLIKSVKSRVP